MLLIEVVSAVWPKKESQETQEFYQWRQLVSAGLIAGVSGMAFGISWAIGLLSAIGISGFVSAAEFQSTKSLLMDIRLGQIDTQIINARVKQCEAIMEGNADARMGALRDLQEKMAAYEHVAKRAYPRLPECPELVPTAGPELRAGNVRPNPPGPPAQ